ncbi:MAG: response regulator, partial [Armatimonadota bacterium]|nr:response regulator [Armatimonadota bacterium]MDW8155396.1 response regulator [Armatimonadota bacterium]
MPYRRPGFWLGEAGPGVAAGPLGRLFLAPPPSSPQDRHDPWARSEPLAEEPQGPTVLVVDDEEALCHLIRDALARRGYRVLVATS